MTHKEEDPPFGGVVSAVAWALILGATATFWAAAFLYACGKIGAN